MKSQIRATLVLFLSLWFLTGILYPLAVTFLAQVAFPWQANGSILIRRDDGAAIGSELIGQPFAAARYFWGRPSATDPVPYNPQSSAGSNLGPTNPILGSAVEERVRRLRGADPAPSRLIPVDLVTTSASGLDPHISPAAAEYQVPRVASARGLAESDVLRLVRAHTLPRTWGFLGERRVNVLSLNLALDQVETTRARRP